MMGAMSPEPKPGVIGSLPRTRPHRRSAKRAAAPATAAPPEAASAKAAAPKRAAPAKAAAPKRAAAPKATASKRAAAPVKPRTPQATAPPEPVQADTSPGSHGVVETAVQAAAELAEIGLHAGARALRRAVSRLPRP
jgi:hypothetical protein